MSKDAVKWAMDDAPMLLTGKGKPDSTARHVLQALAEHAHPDGTNAHPSVTRLRYRTGFDRRTVQRALRRLEDAGLIVRDGSVNGRTRWKLALRQQRPASDWTDLEAEEEAERAAVAERVRRHRAKPVTHSNDVTETQSDDVTDNDVTDPESVRNALKGRYVTHSDSVRNALSAALTSSEPVVKPPENRPPNGRRPTTGSTGRAASGSAALQDEPDAETAETTTAAISCVIALLPRRLRDQLPNPIPRTVTDAIAAELARGLTADQLVARAERRWLEWGYEADAESADGPGILRPVGVALSLVRRGKCTHPRCDDGTDLDTGAACRTCEREAEDRRAATAAPVQGTFLAAVPDLNPSQSPAPRPGPMRTCRGCERPSRALPADGWCRDCRPRHDERTGTE